MCDKFSESVSKILSVIEERSLATASTTVPLIKSATPPRPFTVLVEGNIGSGKSTYLQHFNRLDKEVDIITKEVTAIAKDGGYLLCDGVDHLVDKGDLLGNGDDLLSDGGDLLGDGGDFLEYCINLLEDVGDFPCDGGDLLGDIGGDPRSIAVF